MQANKHETKTHPFAQSKENFNDHADEEAARSEKPTRKPGFLKGKIWIAEDFDASLELEKEFFA